MHPLTRVCTSTGCCTSAQLMGMNTHWLSHTHRPTHTSNAEASVPHPFPVPPPVCLPPLIPGDPEVHTTPVVNAAAATRSKAIAHRLPSGPRITGVWLPWWGRGRGPDRAAPTQLPDVSSQAAAIPSPWASADNGHFTAGCRCWPGASHWERGLVRPKPQSLTSGAAKRYPCLILQAVCPPTRLPGKAHTSTG